MNIRSLVVCLVPLLLSPACTWVKLSPLGESVVLADIEPVNVCEKLGTTSSYSKHTIGPIERNEKTVRDELITLARNRAAEMGGNTIVSDGPVQEGRARFRVYWCE